MPKRECSCDVTAVTKRNLSSINAARTRIKQPFRSTQESHTPTSPDCPQEFQGSREMNCLGRHLVLRSVSHEKVGSSISLPFVCLRLFDLQLWWFHEQSVAPGSVHVVRYGHGYASHGRHGAFV